MSFFYAYEQKGATNHDKAKRENPRGVVALLRAALTSEKCGLLLILQVDAVDANEQDR